MDFIQNYLFLIILNSYVFLFVDGEDLTILRSNNAKSSVEKTDFHWHKKLCTTSCGSFTNMICDDHKCRCIDNYKWDEDEEKCLRKCSHSSKCAINRHCDDGNF